MNRERSATDIDCRNAKVVQKTNPKMDRLTLVIDVPEPKRQDVKREGMFKRKPLTIADRDISEPISMKGTPDSWLFLLEPTVGYRRRPRYSLSTDRWQSLHPNQNTDQ